jgi:hypothetical protein
MLIDATERPDASLCTRARRHTSLPGRLRLVKSQLKRAHVAPTHRSPCAHAVVEGEVDWCLEDQIRQSLYAMELATGAVITVHAYSRGVWDSPLYRAMPFTQHVERDGNVL